MDHGGAPDPAALKLAIGWLSKRDMAAAALSERLIAKGFGEASALGVVAWLSTKGVLNDARLVKTQLERLQGNARSAKGRSKIIDSLAKTGADAAAIEEARESLTDETEAARIDALLRTRYPNGVERGKAGRFLISRGFDEDLIESALDRFLGE